MQRLPHVKPDLMFCNLLPKPSLSSFLVLQISTDQLSTTFKEEMTLLIRTTQVKLSQNYWALKIYPGRNLKFGIREHAMGAMLNGIAYHGIFRPSGATFLVFSDYLRPSIRLAGKYRDILFRSSY